MIQFLANICFSAQQAIAYSEFLLCNILKSSCSFFGSQRVCCILVGFLLLLLFFNGTFNSCKVINFRAESISFSKQLSINYRICFFLDVFFGVTGSFSTCEECWWLWIMQRLKPSLKPSWQLYVHSNSYLKKKMEREGKLMCKMRFCPELRRGSWSEVAFGARLPSASYPWWSLFKSGLNIFLCSRLASWRATPQSQANNFEVGSVPGKASQISFLIVRTIIF